MKTAELLAIVLILASGCVLTTHKVELSPVDGQLHRVVTTEIRDTENPENDTDTILTDALCTIMPDDLGNAGQYIRYESQMGTAQLYIEQFRGHDRPADVLQTAFNDIDTGLDALLAELQATCGDMEQFPELETFIDETFRGDIKNLCVYAYLLSNTPHTTWLNPDAASDGPDTRQIMIEVYAMRIAQFLLNEGYLTPDTAPIWARLITEGTDNGDDMEWREEFAEQLFTDILARKVEITNPDLIDALVHIDLADLSGDDLPSDDGTTDMISDDAHSPTITSDLMVAAAWSYVLFPWGGDEHLNAQLAQVPEPTLSNGWWEEETQTIHWTRPLPGTSELPALCYAAWVDADEDFQKAQFGEAILTGEDLFLYCAWQAGLTEAETTEWGAALAKCTSKSLAPLKRINWPDTDYEDHGVEMIQNAIDGN